MKRIILLLAIMCVGMSASAQLATDSFSEDREREDGWLQRGYRGFVEIGVPISFCCGEVGFSANTIHGYQCSEWFFVGGGLGYSLLKEYTGNYSSNYFDNNYWGDGDWGSVNAFQVFGDLKVTFPTSSRFYPFIEARPGYSDSNHCSGYFFLEIPVGCRIALNDNLGINIGGTFRMNGSDNLYAGPFVSFDF